MDVNAESRDHPEPKSTADVLNAPGAPSKMNSAATTDLPERPAEPKISKGAAKKEAKKAANKALKQESKKENLNKPTAKKIPPNSSQTAPPETEDADSMFKVGFLADVYKERPVGSDGIKRVVTRFPPEPNGFLHIGHSKAIAINFGFAKCHGGVCNLRFDDTNPAGEKQEYDRSIEEMVRWLGYKPAKVTHSSDNFDRLYELAEALIQKGKAYVCHCTKLQIVDQRGGGEGKKPRYACPHRDRPTAESLVEFRAMRDGKYGPNEAALRMKQNLEDGNPQMWDLFAYRIPRKKDKKKVHANSVEAPPTGSEEKAGEKDDDEADEEEEEEEEDAYTGAHYRTGDKWRIYPTYDFTHCLCDSFEGITHSLCTTEFELSRVSYDWLNSELEVYRPMQREYGRLSISGTILSKRKINQLVNEGHVRGWDDPRLYTLPALRRRGIPPGAILSFVNELGVTKAATVIGIKKFEFSVRRYLEATVPRLMLVLDPVKVIIDTLPEDHLEMLELPFSKDPAYGVHSVPFTKAIYIERSDFRETDAPDYFRLAPGKTVGLLKVPFPITATTIERDESSGAILAVHAKYERPEDGSAPQKPKGWIHWVAASTNHRSPVPVKVRIINSLFKSANPSAHPNGFLSDLNPNSEEVFPNAMIETGFEEVRSRAPWPAEAGEKDLGEPLLDQDTPSQTAAPPTAKPGPETVRFQGMRMGYYCVDKESSPNDIVLNQIVTLKEDAGK